MGALPGLPHHVIGRPAVARPTPQCRSDQPNPGAIVPIRRPNAPFETHYRLADPTEWSRSVTPEQAIRAASMIPESLSIRFGWDDLAHKALQSGLLRRSA
jgi:hypothetical protein